MPSFLNLKFFDNYENNFNLIFKYLISQIECSLTEGVIGLEIQIRKFVGNLLVNNDYYLPIIYKSMCCCKNMTLKLEDLGTIVLIMSIINLNIDMNNKLESKKENLCSLIYIQQIIYDGLYILITSSTLSSIQKFVDKVNQFIIQLKNSIKLETEKPKILTQSKTNSLNWFLEEKLKPEIKQNKKSIYIISELWTTLIYKIYLCIDQNKSFNEINKIKNIDIKINTIFNINGKTTSLSMFSGNNMRTNNWLSFLISNLKININGFIITNNVNLYNFQNLNVQFLNNCSMIFGEIQNFESTNFNENDNQNLKNPGILIFNFEKGQNSIPGNNETVYNWICYCVDGLQNFKHSKQTEYKTIISDSLKTLHLIDQNNDKILKFYNKNSCSLIIKLPTFELLFQSKYSNLYTLPLIQNFDDEIIRCSFTTTFNGDIYITTDINLIFMIHTVFSKYSQDLNTTDEETTHTKSLNSTSEIKFNKQTKNVSIHLDRTFECNNWTLNPQIRFLQWGSQQMEAVSVEWLMEKLKISDIKELIPKCIQNNVFDTSSQIVFNLSETNLSNLFNKLDKKK